jgi:uncharacterized protein with von Willebrand factor type A (vWA) domain
VVNDSETTARSELDVIWAGDQVVELMIDTSGSMNGTPMDNAKTASSLLVGQLTDGQTAIGVGEFNSLPFQRYAITDFRIQIQELKPPHRPLSEALVPWGKPTFNPPLFWL